MARDAGIGELLSCFDAGPFASGWAAQVLRAALAGGKPIAVKVIHAGADAKVREDVGLLHNLWNPGDGFIEALFEGGSPITIKPT